MARATIIQSDGSEVAQNPEFINFSSNFSAALDNEGGVDVDIAQTGFTVTNTTTANTISVDQNGNVGTSVATDGAVHIENTGNTGIGLGVYTNIGATADAPLVSIHADNVAFDQPVVYIRNDGVDKGMEIWNPGTLASNKRALHVWTDAAQTVGDLVTFELGSSSSSRHLLYLRHVGEGAAIRVNAAVGPHIQFIGDTPNSTPTDGDMWFDGTNFKVNIAGTDYNLDVTAA